MKIEALNEVLNDLDQCPTLMRIAASLYREGLREREAIKLFQKGEFSTFRKDQIDYSCKSRLNQILNYLRDFERDSHLLTPLLIKLSREYD